MAGTGRGVAKRASRRDGGFTLIEVLVVIAIVSILAGIVLPVFAQARSRFRELRKLLRTGQLDRRFVVSASKSELRIEFTNGSVVTFISAFDAEFLDPPAGKLHREFGSVDRHVHVAQEIRQGAHVVFMPVGYKQPFYFVTVLKQIIKIWYQYINTRHI